MKKINNIVVFDNDKCFLAMLNGYCYAYNIAMTEVDFNMDGINELEKIKPALIVVPLDLVSTPNKSLETGILRRAGSSGQVKICGLNKNSTDIISARLAGWIDVIIYNPFDIGEIDSYLKKAFYLLNKSFTENRRSMERRSFTDRRNFDLNNNGYYGYKATENLAYQHKAGNPRFKDLEIDQPNRCVFLKGHKVDLTPKEFEPVDDEETERINLLYTPYLTPRQLEVLEHIKLGEPNKIIAYKLGMQECTVKVHVRDIMKKFNATNRTQLVYNAAHYFNLHIGGGVVQEV